ncbi:IS4 family transposase [Stappia sp. GBMRC 2046]|uniref:IS4 family transposase n=1 Tax=Stappia sediminis TaxID=2692190 RepID=A0A7X3LUM1_9HYPH|nr:IS4 family transposase [Stappia sediminis]MXN65412.1 IS4 family transposase [Stappia sediminis]
MRHHNSVFHGLQKHIPWARFNALVERYGADRRVRRLSTKSQFLALLYGQLSGAASLRELESVLASHQTGLYHVGARAPSRSTLADANARRPADLYGDLFALMVAQAGAGLRRKMRNAVRILDATKIKLTGLSDGWARFSDQLTAAKLHVIYDPDAGLPLSARTTAVTVNDITPAKQLTCEPGATYIFDLAYYDYAWWAGLHAAGCRFVTRFKTNTRLEETARLATAPGSNVLSDRIGLLPRRLAYARKNPMSDPVREIVVRIKTGKTLRLLTNDLDAPADEIAELYKTRWQIELFFKWIKQNLKIKRFLGTSQNAIRIQLYVALIAFVLIRMAHRAQTAIASPLTLLRLIRANLMHRKDIDALDKPPRNPKLDHRQIEFCGI